MTAVTLEVTPQPKMSWQGVLEVRIDKAIDDRDRQLAVAIPEAQDRMTAETALVLRKQLALQGRSAHGPRFWKHHDGGSNNGFPSPDLSGPQG